MKTSITDLTQRRHLLALAAGLPLLGCASSPAAVGALPAGSHVLRFPAPSVGATSDEIRLHAYRPARWQPNDPVAIVMHGVNRDADRYLREWTEPAEDAGILVLVPEFTQAKFPERNFYNFGNVVDESMRIRPRDQWVFGVVDEAFAVGRKAFGARRERFALYGHSAGAQFVHRYMLMAEASRAGLIISANAGSYTLPNRDANFPWGLANVALTDEDLKRAFERPVVLLLGDKDVNPNHPNLPTDPEAQAQGPYRYARGRYFYDKALAAATRLGVPLRWRLQTVPGVAHSNHGMAAAAIKIMRQDPLA
ncbi:alpha/beta hydrolase [Paracidovorax avenae]|uniref:alpha/beta hydrolase n=1 Tax=Paracidovorax avenae TaxID=80867 RepID=UPI000D15CE24|nr:alpha/beta hydrolase [Paracidovorax avenae]AVS89318.1 alpha/beta hydrolase [Paracidovorax avenae]